jgi:hypothetical protein
MLRKQFQLLFSPIGVLTVLFFTGCLGVGVYKMSAHRNPGPLTAVRTHNEPLGGYASHSEFEQECTHCHAPIHCITDNRCQSCHIEIAQQRTEVVGLHGLLPGTSECQSCHSEHKGRDAYITTFAFNNIDHTELSSFSLENHQIDYAGNTMTCESCHQLGRFGAESMDCTGCHSNENATFITAHISQYGGNCASCHDGHDRLANFDHNQIFPLTGQHIEEECESCHVNKIFAGTPQECVACHTQPTVHDEAFGHDCLRCHTTLAWSPAELRYHTFPLEHGNDSQQDCQVCHATTYTEYSCTTCHDSAETKALHTEENTLTAYENCLKCHPTGQIDVTNDMQVSKLDITGVGMKIDQLPVTSDR